MIEAYERAVLEWFAEAYPPICDMVYSESEDVLLAKKAHLEYPCLMYYRVPEDQALEKGIPYYEPGDEDNEAKKHVMFQMPQLYEASLFLNDEKDLYYVANVLRQKWYRESYVTLRYPDKATQMMVGMRLLSFKLSSERNGVETKGPKRVIKMQWRSVLILEAIQIVPRYTGFRITLNVNENRFKVFSCCKGDSCTLVGSSDLSDK